MNYATSIKITKLHNKLHEARILEKEISDNFKGKNVILNAGKYRGRWAQIQRFHADSINDHFYVSVLIYRQDNQKGLKGKEDFIDDTYHQTYYRLHEVTFEELDEIKTPEMIRGLMISDKDFREKREKLAAKIFNEGFENE